MANPTRCPTKGVLEIEHDGKQFGTYVATIPAGHSLDDVLAADYFGQMQARGPTDRLLRPGDFIDVRSADWSWYVRLMVRACLPTIDQVVTAPIYGPVEFGIPDLPAGWAVEYKGAERKWTVLYRDVEKAALFSSAEEAAAKVAELSGQTVTNAAPATRGKPGRKPKAVAEATAKEPEPVE